MRKQKGAVLIVSLIMLMLITILATSAMTQSNLQIIMAKNYQDNMTAFQSAENGLVMGRNDLQADFAAVKAEFEATGYERLDISIGGPQSFSYEILSMDLINEDAITIVNVKSTGRMNNSTRIVHGIYAHDDDTQCLTLEAGITKLGDGADLTKGRTKVPFQKGKVDIHSVSALAIDNVILERGKEKPIRITVAMDNPAGVFQVEAVLEKKISTSGLQDHVKVDVLVNGDRLVLSHVKRLFRVQMADPGETLSPKEK